MISLRETPFRGPTQNADALFTQTRIGQSNRHNALVGKVGLVLLGLLACALLTLIAAPAFAQAANNDFEVWTYVTISAPVTEKTEVTGDVHVGVTDNASSVTQALLRGIFYFKLNDRVKLGGGYTFLTVGDGAVKFDEHRVIQDVSFSSAPARGRVVLTLRPRLEERFEQGKPGVAVRLRQLTRVDVPVSQRSGLKLIVWNETFYATNSTIWSGKPGIATMLNFAGLGVPLTKVITAEPGYLNFTTFGPGGTQIRHILAAFVSIRL